MEMSSNTHVVQVSRACLNLTRRSHQLSIAVSIDCRGTFIVKQMLASLRRCMPGDKSALSNIVERARRSEGSRLKLLLTKRDLITHRG